ncbi:hypothetical protein HPB50_017276 [Hyalomma asiaticum]|uniref:Uncharacterized protein n=1 Tax=Hyalomma asiaticum TaxID=266040 RepID=A0ACB7T351_HYAAI|nr:hypothetical protein HPB50_017276 [Hyalomma asiaticum]
MRGVASLSSRPTAAPPLAVSPMTKAAKRRAPAKEARDRRRALLCGEARSSGRGTATASSGTERVSRHTAINVCGRRRGVPPWSWLRGGKQDVASPVSS